MSEAKFTKGPWWVNDGKVVMCETGRVAYSYSGHNTPYVQDIKSNAHLIAAAPEMYEALNKARDFIADDLSIGPGGLGLVCVIDDILARAGGDTL